MKTLKRYVFRKIVLALIAIVLVLSVAGSISLRKGRQGVISEFGNFTTPTLDPAPTVTPLQDADHPSYVELPVVATP